MENANERILQKKDAAAVYLDQIRGSMVGGAIGDALGYAIEFMPEESIFSKYGPEGITEYELTGNVAQISDDTQMSLFTANGLLVGMTRGCMRGIAGPPSGYAAMAYQDWLKTQTSDFKRANSHRGYMSEGGISWLLDVPELYSRRAPGSTCLSALKDGGRGSVSNRINHSKGCGGIMRVAPLALRAHPNGYRSVDLKKLDMEGAEIAAITHGHSLGFMPAAAVTHVISRILSDRKEMSLEEIVIDARNAMAEIFEGDDHLEELIQMIDLAVALSKNTDSDLNNIHRLGEGWVAEETLGIAIYCALKYQKDFSKAIITAVNHRGDSDSTGAVTGNILGAVVGYDAIENKWKQNLELIDVILEMADDLCYGCLMEECSNYRDPAWESKYIRMHRAAS